MPFTSWTQSRGFNINDEFKNQVKEIRQSLNIILNPQQPYQLELWFFAPFDATKFRMYCLRFLTECEKARVDPLFQWKEIHGDYFNDTLMLEPPRALSDLGPKKPKFLLDCARETKTTSKTDSPRYCQQPSRIAYCRAFSRGSASGGFNFDRGTGCQDARSFTITVHGDPADSR